MKNPVIESVVIKVIDDNDADTSFLGEYTDKEEPGVIVRSENEYLEKLPEDFEPQERGRDYPFFKPYAGDEKVGTEEYYKYGMQDYKRMEGLNCGDWSFIGIRAEATVKYPIGNGSYRLEKLSSGGLWGIESDSGDYIKEVMQQEVSDLKTHLKAFNVSLKGFDKLAQEAIEKAS